MAIKNLSIRRRTRRRIGIRKRVHGTCERPRLTVFRSGKHIYAQIVDDDKGMTLCSASSRAKDLRDQLVKGGGNVEAAKIVGAAIVEKAKAKQVTQVCFDRGGFRFGGRVKALADAAREAGLKF